MKLNETEAREMSKAMKEYIKAIENGLAWDVAALFLYRELYRINEIHAASRQKPKTDEEFAAQAG